MTVKTGTCSMKETVDKHKAGWVTRQRFSFSKETATPQEI